MYYTKFRTSDMHRAWSCASQIPRLCFISHTKLPQGGLSLKQSLSLYRKFGQKYGWAKLLWVGTLSRDYGNYIHALMFTQDYVSAKTEVKLKNEQVTIFIA